ncbi:MAG: polymer-forming cytoskeletal protein, partial [Phycisphaerales bacterium]|nr:polymer-forming cytoskeletal protein [Phycisphaerales bacterium]
EAGKVTIDGTVNGNMVGRDRVQLSSSAQMKGDLVAAKLVVEEGAVFVGHCTVGPDAAKHAGNKSASMTESKSGAPSPTTVRPG